MTPHPATPSSPPKAHNFSDGFIAHDLAFNAVTGVRPRLSLVVRTSAHEGPVYVPEEDARYFTTVPEPFPTPGGVGTEVRIDRIQLEGTAFPVLDEAVTTLRRDTELANGMTLGLDRRLVVCEQGTMESPARIGYVDRHTGEITGAVESWRDLPFNSPNDVAVKRDGTIWFTDPSYGYLQGFRPQPQAGDYVYRFDPATDRVTAVADAFVKPNGIAFSPDEQTLYVTDSGANQEIGSYYPHLPHHVVAFDVMDGRHLGAPRLVAVVAPGFPDGLETDDGGRIYASAASGVQVFAQTGDLIGEIRLPGAVNFTFGGPDRNVLFITADDAIWAAELDTTGGPRPPAIPQGA